jgi:peptide/nickel transport system substrate-binding protein
VGYLAMNTQHPPFDDLRVRKAVSLAINRDAIVKLVYQGLAIPATGPLAPTTWAHLKQPLTPPDPARARALLDEAGWQPGQKRPRLYVASTPRPYMPAPETVARMIAQNLREIGMEVEVVVNDMDTHIRATSNGDHDLCLLGWSGDNGDPDNFLYILFDSDNTEPGQARNLSFFRDGQLDGILRWGQESLDRPTREKYYLEAQRIIAAKVPWVPLAHAEVVVAERRGLSGVRFPPTAVLDFRAALPVEGRR